MKNILTSTIVVLILATPLWADYQKGNQLLEMHGGTANLSDDIDVNNGNDQVDCGGAGGFQYLYFLKGTPALAIGPDILWSDSSERDPSTILANSESHGAQRVALYQALAKLSYPKGHWRPYVLGGMGAFRSSVEGDITPPSAVTVHTFDSVRYGFAGTWGVGMNFYPREHWYLGLEFRQAILSRLQHTPTQAGEALGIEPVRDPASIHSIMLTMGYKFGAN